ncbi:MAG: hypothetical protein EZS28_047228 [Streblomastix strix]|uniref:Uncharacterized protein n=1 Tax=Streblomastix strix TaxID=222440 RepID=A0A5J4TIC6_9EUKA|nr:MAG: hypothetical protein EZS28_047228 [Streblomastix strix]
MLYLFSSFEADNDDVDVFCFGIFVNPFSLGYQKTDELLCSCVQSGDQSLHYAEFDDAVVGLAVPLIFLGGVEVIDNGLLFVGYINGEEEDEEVEGDIVQS